jgi:hypothetical protein
MATDPPGTSDGSTSSSSDGPAPEGSSGSSGMADSSSSGDGLSFENDVWPILAMERAQPLSGRIASCIGCHGSGAGGLSTPDPGTTYANLLDTPSTSALCADTTRVVPGDPDASCFVIFYEVRLRDQLGWVDQSETDLIRAWVESGAAP